MIIPPTQIINDCVIGGKFPEALKVLKSIPIFKSRSQQLMENYHSIYWNSFSNVFQRNNGGKNNIVNDRQLGFRKGRDTLL